MSRLLRWDDHALVPLPRDMLCVHASDDSNQSHWLTVVRGWFKIYVSCTADNGGIGKPDIWKIHTQG